MPNENCLKDIACPSCGQADGFRITATATFYVTDDGTDAPGDVEWDDASRIRCTPCGHESTVGAFTTGERFKVWVHIERIDETDGKHGSYTDVGLPDALGVFSALPGAQAFVRSLPGWPDDGMSDNREPNAADCETCGRSYLTSDPDIRIGGPCPEGALDKPYLDDDDGTTETWKGCPGGTLIEGKE